MHDWAVHKSGQWANLADLIGNGDIESSKLNEKQRKWIKFLEHTIPGDEKSPFARDKLTGWPIVKAYPTDADIKDSEEWEKFYQICQEAWYLMKHDPNYSSYDTTVKAFIDNYSYLFSDVSSDVKIASPDIEKAINAIVSLLDEVNKKDPNVLNAMGIFDLNKLKTDIADQKYNKSKESREEIQKIASQLLNPNDTIKKKLDQAVKSLTKDPLAESRNYVLDEGIGNIVHDHHWKDLDYSTNIAVFKKDFPDLLKDIYDESKVFDAFKAKEPSPNIISNAIDKVKKDIDYDNKESENFIHEKAEEKLTFVEQIKKWSADTYEDYFKKYEGFVGGKKVGHPDKIKVIIRAIDKEDIKPTDGLEKIIEKSSDLFKKINLKDANAAEGFKWFIDALKEMNENPNMTSNMKGTLKSGDKIRQVAGQLIIRATKTNTKQDIRNAEIAMDLLSVIQYGHTTSKTLDMFKDDKDLFKIASNKDLSWNKNEGVQFVTKAMDKTFRTAFFLAGRGTTWVYNKFRMKNKKFTENNISPVLKATRDNMLAENAAGRAAAEKNANDDAMGTSELAKKKKSAGQDQKDAITALEKMKYSSKSKKPEEKNREIIDAARKDVEKFRSDERIQESIVSRYTNLIDKLEIIKPLYKDLDDLKVSRADIEKDTALSSEGKIAQLTAIANTMLKIRDQIINEIGNGGELDLSIIGKSVVDLSKIEENDEKTIQGYIYDIENDPVYKAEAPKLLNIQSDIYDRQSQIDKYTYATEDLKYAEALIEERKKLFDEWDDKHQDTALRLEQYWNALQGPGMTKLGLFKKRVEDGRVSIADRMARMGSGLTY